MTNESENSQREARVEQILANYLRSVEAGQPLAQQKVIHEIRN
jgi:hypothetical protein